MCAAIHGTLISIFDHGILITGSHGIGKSELALGLLDRGHRLVADDNPELLKRKGRLIGRCGESHRGLLHVHGIGILDIPRLYGKQAVEDEAEVELCIHLTPEAPVLIDDDLLDGKWEERIIHQVTIPTLILSSSSTRNSPLLVESAVRQHLINSIT